jgi:L-fuconolactonase
MIIDSHIHAVAADTTRYPLKQGPKSPWLRSMPAEQIRAELDEAGVDRAVLVQAFGAYGFDNAYATDSAAAAPDRFVSVCTVDPLAPDAADSLSFWVTQRGAAGLRLHATASGVPLDHPHIAALMRRATNLNISVCVLTQFPGLVALPDLLAQCPDVPVAIDHMGFPPVDEAPVDMLFSLARFPNLFLKFSSLTLHASVRPETFLRRTVDHFGPHRLIWGSNFPASVEEPLREQLTRARAALDFLAEPDRRAIFGETASRLWPTSVTNDQVGNRT